MLLRARNDLSDTTELGELDAASLGTLLSFNHVEFDRGAFLDHRASEIVGVDEDVLSAALRGDESKTLCRVEELNRTFLHLLFP